MKNLYWLNFSLLCHLLLKNILIPYAWFFTTHFDPKLSNYITWRLWVKFHPFWSVSWMTTGLTQFLTELFRLQLLNCGKMFKRDWFIGESKSALGGNFRIFLSLRFFVKSILENVEVLKLSFLPFLGLWILLIWSISAFKKCKNSKESRYSASKCVKMADFTLVESPKLISRKIWVIEKSWNFHTAW